MRSRLLNVNASDWLSICRLMQAARSHIWRQKKENKTNSDVARIVLYRRISFNGAEGDNPTSSTDEQVQSMVGCNVTYTYTSNRV